MAKSFDNRHAEIDSAKVLLPTESCMVALRTMIRQVKACSTGDVEFDAEILKSLNIAFADIARWYLLVGSEMGMFEIVVPHGECPHSN